MLGISVLMGAADCTCRVSYNYHDKCDPAVSYSECYATRRDPDSEQVAMAIAIALRWIDEHAIEDQPWDWGPSVLMFAMTLHERATSIRDHKAWLDYRMSRGTGVDWSDHCPRDHAISLLSETSTDEYQQVVDDVLHYG
jgi:hypothetical protein